MERTALAATGLAAVVALVAEVRAYLSPDVAWYLYAARRLLDGARLYVDVSDINPPLVIALDVPAVLLARSLGISEAAALRGCVIALVAMSLSLCALVLRAAPERWPRRYVLAAVLFVLVPLVRGDFGQREHLMLALVLPYLIASAVHADGRPFPRWVSVAIGAFAGIGLAIKPYFAILWLAVEGYLWFSRVPRGPRLRLEAVLAAAVPVIYGVTTIFTTPAYLALVRLLGPAYAAYFRNSPLAILIHEPWAWLCVFVVISFVALRETSSFRALADVLCAATVAFLVAALAQQKGWRYHLYPAFACALLLLAVLTLDATRAVRAGIGQRLYAVLGVALGAGIVATVTGDSLRQGLFPRSARYLPYPDFPRLVSLVGERGAGGSIVVLSNNLRAAFPLVNYTGVGWGFRFNAVWFLGAEYGNALRSADPIVYHAADRLSPVERYMTDALIDDMGRYRPRLLIVERPLPASAGVPIRRLDYLAYFGRDSRFSALLANYRPAMDVGDYQIFERLSGGAGSAQ